MTRRVVIPDADLIREARAEFAALNPAVQEFETTKATEELRMAGETNSPEFATGFVLGARAAQLL